MAINSNRLDTLMPGRAMPRGRARAEATKPFLARVRAAVRGSMTLRHRRQRRRGPADREAFAAPFTAGITRGATLFVDHRRRG